MNIVDCPSHNFDSREGHVVDMLVMHYTGMPGFAEAKSRLCDRDAKVSAHYMVDEDGAVYKLVDEKCRAWHAGLSSWRGHSNINQRSIGIEIVNPGHEFGYRPFPPVQMKSVTFLAQSILSRHSIPPRNVVAHSDIAPSRKEDPGELFDWKTLARFGIGLWPEAVEGRGTENGDTANGLSAYGYDIADLPKAILAFQRHFRPKSLTGQWDSECAALLAALLAMV